MMYLLCVHMQLPCARRAAPNVLTLTVHTAACRPMFTNQNLEEAVSADGQHLWVSVVSIPPPRPTASYHGVSLDTELGREALSQFHRSTAEGAQLIAQ